MTDYSNSPLSPRMAETLQKWSKEGKLSTATLSSDGATLTLPTGDDAAAATTLDASQPCTISFQSKSCTYSLASLFLQIVNPTQSLMAYRNACKTYGISDMVGVLDKPIVVGYFLDQTQQQQQQQQPPESSNAAAVATETPKPSSSSSDRRSDRRKHERSSKKDGKAKKRSSTSSTDNHTDTKKKKKQKVPMTNEQLFDNLNIVVDKRSATDKDAEHELLHQALSADGFEVTPELLAEHRAALNTIMPLEIPVGNSASILRPTTLAGRDFGRVLELYLETTKTSSNKKSGSINKAKKGSSATSKSDKSYLIGKKPVIVVPKGMTTPITMANALDFFGHANFVPRGTGKKQTTTTFSRKLNARIGGGMMEYELMDNPTSKLGQNPREWERIVAVITLGQSWQFKDWPGPYKNAVQLFSRTYGFYIGMEGAKFPAELEGWAVRRGKLNRDKRGLDSVTYASFWNGLDEWMAVHKPELLPKSQA